MAYDDRHAVPAFVQLQDLSGEEIESVGDPIVFDAAPLLLALPASEFRRIVTDALADGEDLDALGLRIDGVSEWVERSEAGYFYVSVDRDALEAWLREYLIEPEDVLDVNDSDMEKLRDMAASRGAAFRH